jgi:hypothetical protein
MLYNKIIFRTKHNQEVHKKLVLNDMKRMGYTTSSWGAKLTLLHFFVHENSCILLHYNSTGTVITIFCTEHSTDMVHLCDFINQSSAISIHWTGCWSNSNPNTCYKQNIQCTVMTLRLIDNTSEQCHGVLHTEVGGQNTNCILLQKLTAAQLCILSTSSSYRNMLKQYQCSNFKRHEWLNMIHGLTEGQVFCRQLNNEPAPWGSISW